MYRARCPPQGAPARDYGPVARICYTSRHAIAASSSSTRARHRSARRLWRSAGRLLRLVPRWRGQHDAHRHVPDRLPEHGHLLRRAQPRVRLEPHPPIRGLRLLANTGRGHRAGRRLPHRPVRQPHHVRRWLHHDGRGIPHAVPASRRHGAAGLPPLFRGDAVLHRPGRHHHRLRAGRLAHHDVHGQ